MAIYSRKVLKIYRTLDKDQLQFVFDKKIEDTLPITEWLTKLNKIAEMDTIGDESRRQSGILSLVFCLVTILTTLLSILKPILFFFPVAFFILFAYFLITYILLRKIDIGNNMRMFIVPMLKHLQSTESVTKPFPLKMDFSNPIKKDYLTQTVEEEKEKPIHVYKHHWMDGNLEFKDGVKITWEINDVIKKKEVHTIEEVIVEDVLSKYEIQHVLNMHFSAPKEYFVALNKDMMETDDGKYYIVSIHKKDIKEGLDEGMTPQVFLSSVEEGYRYVKPKNS
jgi:hypothetical protein